MSAWPGSSETSHPSIVGSAIDFDRCRDGGRRPKRQEIGSQRGFMGHFGKEHALSPSLAGAFIVRGGILDVRVSILDGQARRKPTGPP